MILMVSMPLGLESKKVLDKYIELSNIEEHSLFVSGNNGVVDIIRN